ncbi:ExeA family protein [Roseitranquillus sediminis]|uniref:ExeA family protein n=1 Tax=Roseitranquillus sediminis TaxID=2809051 RepID=UPI001D0C0010|nr:AAA family ATPase [Roseitranquillus sediminis]MBM9596186.1 AAA family ATPase [Roseitranquillus sediminis]
MSVWSDPDLYTEFFGLSERPFTLLPDPDFLYWSDQHKRAFAVLEYGILTRAPITLITGEVGAGKTTLLQTLLRSIDDDVTVGLISNAQGGRGELISWVLSALDVEVPPGMDYVAMFRLLQEFLISEYADGRRVILIFDEAQNLSMEGLEELRMLTNINSNKDELLQLVLVGQPELRQMVMRPELRQFAQRVAANFHLPKMDEDTVRAYVTHRLRVAGGSGGEFDDDACELIAEATGGVPRLVNQLADIAMVYAWTQETPTVTRDTVDLVLAEGLFLGDTHEQPEPDR